MRPPGRCGFLLAVLVFALLAGACSEWSGKSGRAAAGSAARQAPANSYLEIGKRMLAAREPDLAMKAFVTSMTVDGITSEAMTGAGLAAQQQGLLTSARRYFEQARKLAPQSVIAHNNLGVVLYQLKEYYPARNAFRRAYSISGGKSEIAERNLNRVEATIALMEMVPKKDPAISIDVIRLGSSEYRLIEAASPEAEVSAE